MNSDPDPIHDLFNPFHGPLTSEDIERIEEGMNMLVSDLFKNDPEQLEEELEAPLWEKN